MSSSKKSWVVYLLECRDGTYYCGITNDLDKRMKDHNDGKGAKYTRSRRPFRLIGAIPMPDKAAAAKLEYFVKQKTKKEKRKIFQN